MCNVDTDSLDGDAAFAAATERELRESMVRLQDFIGTQPRASGEAIDSLESFLATEPAARGLAVPPRSASQQEYTIAETSAAADIAGSAHRAAASQLRSCSTDSPTATSSRASVADWLLTPPSTQTSAAAVTSAELAVVGEGARLAQEQQDDSEAKLRPRGALVSSQRSTPLSSPGARPPDKCSPEASAADKEASATDKPRILVSPQPAPPPQPHLKTPQRQSPHHTAPVRARHECLLADAQGDSPSASSGAAHSESAAGASACILGSDSPGSRALGKHLADG